MQVLKAFVDSSDVWFDNECDDRMDDRQDDTLDTLSTWAVPKLYWWVGSGNTLMDRWCGEGVCDALNEHLDGQML